MDTLFYWLFHPATIAMLTHLTIMVILVIRVIMQRPSIGVSLAWLALIMAVPYVGAALYVLVGERRIGPSRARRLRELAIDFRQLAAILVQPDMLKLDMSRHRQPLQALSQLGNTLAGSPVVHASHLQLISETEDIFRSIIRGIDQARSSVLIEFYIWSQGGLADDVMAALQRAAQRGVQCLVLIDALGARPWWRSDQPQKLREAGVQLQAALPVGLLQTLVGRNDLRLHRKIVVIDGETAWTGSMNLVDPRYFKQDSGVGQWVDAMVRITGAAVAPLAATMLGDWILERRESLTELVTRLSPLEFVSQGNADVQVIRSGPGQSGDALLQMILACIYTAQRELVLTTPYLIPEESLLQALRGAAARGVMVDIIIPEKVDSFLTRHASRSYFDDLLSAGIRIRLYRGGLLHTKSIRVDDDLSMFGTVNLDMRSLWLNYEVSLFIYDREFTRTLAELQTGYLTDSVMLDAVTWSQRRFSQRMLQNTLRLVSPLL